MAPSGDRIAERVEEQYQSLLARPDVKEAVFAFESAQLRRDSVSRKLCAGSNAVTDEDLGTVETALSNRRTLVIDLAHKNPLLFRHPLLAGHLAA